MWSVSECESVSASVRSVSGASGEWCESVSGVSESVRCVCESVSVSVRCVNESVSVCDESVRCV